MDDININMDDAARDALTIPIISAQLTTAYYIAKQSPEYKDKPSKEVIGDVLELWAGMNHVLQDSFQKLRDNPDLLKPE